MSFLFESSLHSFQKTLVDSNLQDLREYHSSVLVWSGFCEEKKHLQDIWFACMVFTTEGFFEVAIESWPEWDLNL